MRFDHLKLTAVGDGDALGATATFRANTLDSLHNIEAFGDIAEYAMLAIEPSSLDSADKELAAVGVRTSVGHGQDTGAGMPKGEVLIGEFLTVDALTAGSVSAGEVTALKHEIGDDAMEHGSLVVEGLAELAHATLTSAQSAEVFARLGSNVTAERHLNTSGGFSTDIDVEKYNRKCFCHFAELSYTTS